VQTDVRVLTDNFNCRSSSWKQQTTQRYGSKKWNYGGWDLWNR